MVLDLHLGAYDAGRHRYNVYSKGNFTGAAAGVITNPPTLSDYNNTDNERVQLVAGDRQINTDGSSTVGQIGLNATEWPFIQTFDFTQGEFDIILEQAGANEVVTLDYDSDDLDDYAGIELDRNSASQGSQVFLFITDNQLNIDPTNEDIVLFNVTSGSEGVIFTNSTVPNMSASDKATHAAAYDNYFSDNGKLLINYDVTSVGVDVFTDGKTLDDAVADKYLVFYEDADNTGTFSNIDDDDNSNLDVNVLAKRGTTATIDYNDSAQSFIVANDFGSIDMDESAVGEEWNSGEILPVTLLDQDLNKNTGSDEDLLVSGVSNANNCRVVCFSRPSNISTFITNR